MLLLYSIIYFLSYIHLLMCYYFDWNPQILTNGLIMMFFLVPRGFRTSKYTLFCNGGMLWRKNNTEATEVPRRVIQSTKFGEDFTMFKTFENDCCSSRNQHCIMDLKGENFFSIASATRYKLHYFLNASLFLLSSVIYVVLHFLLAPFFVFNHTGIHAFYI